MNTITATKSAAPRLPSSANVATLGMTGGALGLIAGLIELTVGSSIRSWVGNKNDTVSLGIVTVVLAAIALASAAGLRPPRAEQPATRLLLTLGVAVPAAIGFTTVGRLWWVPGAFLLVAAVASARRLRGHTCELAATTDRYWTDALVILLGIYTVTLGATTISIAGLIGVVGGLLTITLVVIARRLTTTLGVVGLIGAVVPFAAITWWSVITPLLALLTLAIGIPTLTRHHRAPSRRGRSAGIGLRRTGNSVEVVEVSATEAAHKLGGRSELWRNIRRDGVVIFGARLDNVAEQVNT